MKLLKITAFIIVFLALIVAGFKSISGTHTNLQSKNEQHNAELLLQIEKYQTQYWTIIKRNNMFLKVGEKDPQIENDKLELKKLYKDVDSKINKNNKFYKELSAVHDKYSGNIEKAKTQTEMNLLAGEYLDQSDKILYEVYQKIKKTEKNKQADWEALKENEVSWMKEMENYKKYITGQDLGSMFGILYSQTIQDIINFRALLLIYYMQKAV